MSLKKLKIILQHKIIIVLIIVLIVSLLRIINTHIPIVDENVSRELILEIKNIKYQDNIYTIEFNNLISYYQGDFFYDVGDTVKIRGNYQNITKNMIPNLFNYKEYLQSKNIQYQLKISAIELVKKNNNILKIFKNKIHQRINSLSKKEYLYTFLLGDMSYLSDDIKSSFQNNGLSYLLSLGSFQVFLLTKCLKKILIKLRIKKKLSLSIMCFFLSFYLFLTNFTIGVFRSSLCYLLKEFMRLKRYYVTSWKIIVIVLCILLIINPFYLYRVGFYYSFIISLGISFLPKKKNVDYFKKILSFSFFAFILSLPITIYTNYEINFLAIILGIIFLPFISYIIMPLSILFFLFPSLSFIWEFCISFLEYISFFFNKLTFLNFIFRKPSLLVLVFYYIILFISIRKRKCLWIFIISLFFHININKIIKESFISFLDVGQGDAIVLKNNSYVSLIDTGNNNGIRIITYLKSFGIKKINNLILTHGDFDHMGEAINIVNNFKVEKVIFNYGEFNDLEKELIKVLDKKKIKYYSCIKELNIDNNKLYFLQTKEYDNENDNSNVIYTELNGYKFMFMGDAGVGKEKDIINKYNLSNIDVLKIGHHGSKTSSGKEFINKINPRYSIISVGKNNRYGHPNKEVLNNLEYSKIYRTDIDGSIMFEIKNNKLQIETCSP